MFLPTVLRPPRQPQTQSAELSPDAPPDDEQSIVSGFQRGTSGTAGAGEAGGLSGGLGEGPQGPGGGGPSVRAPVAPLARACPHGIGNPPRQTFSLYSAPCASAFVGDNGGATAPGVTADEVRVAVGYRGGNIGTNGPVALTPDPGQSAQDHTWSILQQWINANFQFYGRRLRLYVANINTDDTAQQRAIASQTASTIHPFAADMSGLGTMEALARSHVIDFNEVGEQWSDSFLDSLAPYGWQWRASTTTLARMSAEYICKKLAGKDAQYAGDPVFQMSTRVFGLVYNENQGVGPMASEVQSFLRERCGVSLAAAIGFHSDGYSAGNDSNAMSTAVSKLRQSGVTTVIDALDFVTMAEFSNVAEGQAYEPEWFVTGRSYSDSGFYSALSNQSEWAHAFGISALEIDDINPVFLDGNVAYNQIEPGARPDYTISYNLFPQLEQIANGIQMAGPHLTVATFEQGLFRMGAHVPDPKWSLGGHWGPHHSYVQDVGEIWWDPTSQGYSTSGDTWQGNFRWTHGGQKWGAGELDGDTSQLFKQGVASRAETSR